MYVFNNLIIYNIIYLKETRCRNPPTAPQKIERVISLCQDEIKLSILRGMPLVLLFSYTYITIYII